LPILFEEVVGTAVVNGFAIAPVPSSAAVAIRDNLELHGNRFLRLAEAFGFAEGKRQSADARKLARQKTITAAAYLAFLRRHLGGMNAAVAQLTAKAGADPFGLKPALARLKKAVAAGSAPDALPSHATYLNGLDAMLTMLQLEDGDPACVLHNVEWQRELYSTARVLAALEASKTVVRASNEFQRGFEGRKFGPEQFPKHAKRLLPAYRETAEAVPKLRLGPLVDELEKSLGSAAAAQRAHRQVLLRLNALRTSDNGGGR
jgi:hypothetical protein